MGGNIKFITSTRRYLAKEYHQLEPKMAKIMYDTVFDHQDKTIHQEECVQAIKSYNSKESFGDMDLVLNSKYLKPNWTDIIKEHLNLEEGDSVKQGNILSFPYENLQVDNIVMSEKNFHSSLNYFAYNDFNNLLGIITKKLGVKLGHDGLSLIYKIDDHVISEINLTKDFKTIYTLLGLDYNTYLKGFNSLPDIFEFVASSPYFHPNLYLLENRNNDARTRDRKRNTYHLFLLWMKDREFPNAYPYEDFSGKNGYYIKEPFFSNIITPMFPSLKEECETLLIAHHAKKTINSKIKGEDIMIKTGLKNQELGDFIQFAKVTINSSKELLLLFSSDKKEECDKELDNIITTFKNRGIK